jgi:hypothetical protein
MDIARSRHSGGFPNTATVTYFANFTDCTNATDRITPVAFGAFGESKSTDDYVTPGFHRRVAKGEVFFKGYSSLTVTKIASGYSTLTLSYAVPSCPLTNPWVYQQYGSVAANYVINGNLTYNGSPVTFAAYEVVSGSDYANLTNETKTKCMANRQSGSTNYVESLAELDKAYHMLVNPFENVRKFVRDFDARPSKRLRWIKNGVVLTSFASSEYLRFRYGFTPLWNDCKAALKALKSSFDTKPKRYTSRASGTIQRLAMRHPTFGNGQFTATLDVTSVQTITCRAMWLDEYRKSAFTELGLTFHNLFGVWWELTHYSFVVDWFANVGDVIYANIPRVDIRPLGGTVTYIDDKVSTFVPNVTSLAPVAPYVASSVSLGDSLMYRSRQKYRNLNDGSSSLVINHDFKFDSWTRCLDALALLQQQLARIDFDFKK